MTEVEQRDHFLAPQTYDTLKPFATVLLPAAGALYFALAQIWGFPAAEKVTGSIAALNVFIGVLISVSSRSYKKSETRRLAAKQELEESTYAGSINIQGSGEDTELTLAMDSEYLNNDTVVLKVNRPKHSRPSPN